MGALCAISYRRRLDGVSASGIGDSYKTGGNAGGGFMKFVVVGCLFAAAVAAVGCVDGPGGPTGPSDSAAVSGLAATARGNEGTLAPLLSASPRSGDLHVTKECSEYQGRAGQFCTITSSNVKAIEVGSRVFYAQAAGATSLDSDVILDTPGPGNNAAFGHCRLDFATRLGLCTFSRGTGTFSHFDASAHVSSLGGFGWAWDGTYSFVPRD
jgi:hypothetical protein